MNIKGRYAPSPTGRMHAGNIYAALMAYLVAKSQGGSMVLRIEDLDRERSKPKFIDQVCHDLELLGLTWDEGPYFQHDRDGAYEEAFRSLQERELVYPCFCTRADLHAASAPHFGEKQVYPGTCRNLSDEEIAFKRTTREPAYRLRVAPETICIDDAIQGTYCQELEGECGDFIVKRSDGAFAYQLAVVVDDAAQGITSVVRGMDLLVSTPQQVYLQELLGYPTPSYAHIPLLVAKENRRLSKRDHDASLEELLARYKTPEGIIGHVAFLTGIIPEDAPACPSDLLKAFNLETYAAALPDNIQIQWA